MFLYPVSTYLIEGIPLLVVTNKANFSKDFEKKLKVAININRGQEISGSYYYGFSQLMEIALKALSPGINDPDTAIISLQALGDLFAYRLQNFPDVYMKDKDNKVRIIIKEQSLEDAFREFILPIWDYGENDRLIQNEMLHILTQLKMRSNEPVINKLLHSVHSAVLNKQLKS